MAVKIREATLCPSCEKLLTDGHIVHKEVPYSQGSAKCENCHKRRYCTRYKIIVGGTDNEQDEADQ